MEGETPSAAETVPPENILKELAANETSLIALIKTLLSPKTLPHLLMIVIFSTILYFVANSNGGEDIAALGFISLSLGYVVTAVFSTNQKVRSWITISNTQENAPFNLSLRLKSIVRICAFPLSLSVAIGLLLMMFTVFMAIWTLTSKSFGPKFKILSTENALPWGLAFGYAYAGSVAMLATALDNITYVMVAGHIIAFLTITWMQRSVLKKVLSQHDIDVAIQRRIDAHALKAASTTQVADIKVANDEQKHSETDTSADWQEDTSLEWSGEVGKTIGEVVEWNEVIELDD